METSGSSNESFLPIKKRDATDDSQVVTDVKSAIKYKGVFKKHNGTWGAQLYEDRQRIWLGTFRSAREAAMAYDSASIKLGKGFDTNLHRNFPESDSTVYEREFQERYTTEAVLNMITDGSYPHKLSVFLEDRSQVVKSINTVGSKQSGEDLERSCMFLFQMELTLSDVGKLNRLVIPTDYAVKYLPLISEREEGEIGGDDFISEREAGEIGGDVEDTEFVFYDRAMREWKFRYCYWSSSQSYAFTRGWNDFVKEKQLKEKDVIVFKRCNVETLEGMSQNVLMIDVHERESKMVVSSQLEKEEPEPEEKKGGFMLFGVRIQ